MAALAESAELIVARVDGRVAGAVAYVGPGKEKAPFFSREWPVLRMLVVDPEFRGRGIGRALAQECIRRAVRDKAPLIALHTSRIMKVALSLYERMGFRYLREAPAICGVPYGVYVLALDNEAPDKAIFPTS
jgi:ribosomal protein S18 acetylase RimI-like enzyme